MKPATVQSLNNLNQEFYNQIGPIWNPASDYYWEGWEILLESIKVSSKVEFKVLDIGCGNARFFQFLQDRLPEIKISYTGIDNSNFLLTQGQLRIAKELNNCNLINTDVLKTDWFKKIDSRFDLVVMFGLMHHIPGKTNRREIFSNICNLINPTGKLIFTTYQFLDLPRLQKRVVDFSKPDNSNLAQTLGVNLDDLETGDYILDWVKLKTSYRYCHYFDQDEIKELLGLQNLTLEKDFLADDRLSNRNRYFILEKKI
ncbi:MAG: class I SAM-dependent methyltransferase [bacterium]